MTWINRSIRVVAVMGLFCATGAFGQGSLTPAGAPAPMMKTLGQLETRTPITSLPYTISQSGSYYLTGDLTCLSPTGIYITASSVVLELQLHLVLFVDLEVRVVLEEEAESD